MFTPHQRTPERGLDGPSIDLEQRIGELRRKHFPEDPSASAWHPSEGDPAPKCIMASRELEFCAWSELEVERIERELELARDRQARAEAELEAVATALKGPLRVQH